MGKIAFEWQSRNFQEIDANFDKLTKKEQEAIVKASKLGPALDKAGNSAKNAGKKGASAFSGLTNKILGAVAAEKVLAAGVRLVNEEFEKQIELQKKAGDTQQSFTAAIGNFRANNAAAIKENPQLISNVIKFAQSEGTKGGGTPTEILSALTQVRSLAGSGFTLEQQLGAIRQAVEGKILDPTASLGEIATANLRTQKSLGVSEVAAQNTLVAFGPNAGGDVNAFVGEFGKLAGATDALRKIEERKFGEAKTTFADTLALEGIVSQSLGIDAAKTTTLVTNVLAGIGGARIGDKKINFQSENAVDQLIELSNRVLSGEFGEGKERQQLFESAKLRGADALPLLASVANSPELRLARRQLTEATRPGAASSQSEALAARTALERDEARRRAARGETEAFLLNDQVRGNIDRTRDIVSEVRTQGGLGTIGDPTQIIRDALITSGAIDRERALEAERIAQERAIRVGQFAVGRETLTAASNFTSGATIALDVIARLATSIEGLKKSVDDKTDKTPDTGGQK